MADTEVAPLVSGAPVSSEEIEAAFSGPAILANKVLVTLNPVAARISFLEIGADLKPRFRAAVALNIGDLVALKNLLDTQLKDVQFLPVPQADGDAQ